ncbi:MAG: lipase family protein [Candidatus Omnitrophota bacterium]|nr:lipase family protein [Candidatus Omnitrophota bacterium]
MDDYFKYPELLTPPIKRAAYSDRTAWLMAEMSRLAYLIFETSDAELKTALLKADFELVRSFNCDGTQAFLVKRDKDKMAVLAFRGTQKEDPRDIVTDLEVNFYQDQNGVKIHDGFYRAFKCVETDINNAVDILKDFALYVTGHSLGGALALIATRALNSDNLAACYTYGSPKVGNEEFGEDIKPPIYRVVNAYDIVPISPPTYIFEIMYLLPWEKVRNCAKKFLGYDHHGDMRYLSPCGDKFEGLKIISNYNDFLRLIGIWTHRKESIKCHDIDAYCEKLGQWALKRLDVA